MKAVLDLSLVCLFVEAGDEPCEQRCGTCDEPLGYRSPWAAEHDELDTASVRIEGEWDAVGHIVARSIVGVRPAEDAWVAFRDVP